MKHTRIKIFNVKENETNESLENTINNFITDKVVVEMIPIGNSIIVRYKETY